MSVLGIASSIISQFDALASHGKSHQVQHGFQQLSQDLQSGNLSQAQSDFASLQQLLPTNPQNLAVTSSAQTNNPLATAVSQLAKDLQSGNVNAAQSDLANVQQDVQQLGQSQRSGPAHHHHHHSGSGESGQSSDGQTPISTLFEQLGQSLQSGNLSAAQQAYASLQQDVLLSGFNTSSAASIAPANSNLSLTA